MVRAAVVGTPLGELAVARSAEGIVATAFADPGEPRDRLLEVLERAVGGAIGDLPRAAARELAREVEGYFDGEGAALRAPVDLRLAGAGFGRRVLQATRAIAFGEVATYGDVAAAAGSPRAGRAAGNALAHCPIELWIPCHRVVHADGHVGGYGRHEDRKRFLLRHEGLEMPSRTARPGTRRDVPGELARD